MDKEDQETYPLLNVDRLTGDESLRNSSEVLPVSVLQFWQWSASDLVSNLMRGRFAEFIVARATGVDVINGVRNEWDAFDLTTPEGVTVEVKSAAYLQSWYQARLSKIGWRVGPTRKWDAATGVFESEIRWQADVYVFALFKHQNQASADPLDVAQWEFYVLPVARLRETPGARTISLARMQVLAEKCVSYEELADQIKTAAAMT